MKIRCRSCGKKFDYEDCYGICPKCGAFNQKESREELHEELHERFGDESVHEDHQTVHERFGDTSEHRAGEPLHDRYGGEEASWDGARPDPFTLEEGQSRRKRSGGTFLIVSILVFVLGLGVFFLGLFLRVFSAARESAGTEEAAEANLNVTEVAAGETFSFQQGMELTVTEARRLAGQETLPQLEDGLMLVGVHLTGTSDGGYEDYNEIYGLYLEAEGAFREPISLYYLEPYEYILGARPLLDELALWGDDSCDGWFVFLASEGTDEVHFWLDAYDASDYDGGELLGSYCVNLTLAEGGEADAE